MKTQVFVHITRNELTNRQVLDKAFTELKDGRYKVDIARANQRSNPQNAYLHGVVIPIVLEGLREVGYDEVKTPEDAKVVIKTLFLKKKLSNINNGDVIEVIRKTSELSTIEMMEFIDEVVRWASIYLNRTIPAPNTQAEIWTEKTQAVA